MSTDTTPIKYPHQSEIAARARHYQLVGALAAGEVATEGGTLRELIKVAGCLRVRIRAKLSAGTGTLKAYYARPDASGVYLTDGSQNHTTQPATNVTLGDTAEHEMEIDDLYGEGYLDLQVVDAGNGGATATIDYVIVSAL